MLPPPLLRKAIIVPCSFSLSCKNRRGIFRPPLISSLSGRPQEKIQKDLRNFVSLVLRSLFPSQSAGVCTARDVRTQNIFALSTPGLLYEYKQCIRRSNQGTKQVLLVSNGGFGHLARIRETFRSKLDGEVAIGETFSYLFSFLFIHRLMLRTHRLWPIPKLRSYQVICPGEWNEISQKSLTPCRPSH